MFLISLNNKIECTVCGGTGTGLDGAYQVEAIEDSVPTTESTTEEVDDGVSISDNRKLDVVDEEPTERQTPTHFEERQFSHCTVEEKEEIQSSEEDFNDEEDLLSENAALKKDVPSSEPDASSTKEEQSVNGVASIRSASENCSVTIVKSEHSVTRPDSNMHLRVETPSIDHREVIDSPRSMTTPRSPSSTTSPRSAYKTIPRRHPNPDIGPSFDECPVSPTGSATKSVSELKEDFEAKRHYVSKEIGKRMMKGWTLLDMSCPECLMPLLSDPHIGQETCVLCGPTAKLPSAITVHEQKHDPPSADEEDVVTQASIFSQAKSEKPEPPQELSIDNETEVIQTETKDAEPKQTFSLQLPASFDMTDENALRTLIALVKANQPASKAKVQKEELPPRPSPVISTAQAADDVSHVTMDTPTNVQSPRTPEVHQEEPRSLSHKTVDAPEINQQRSDVLHDILEDEVGVEIMRKISSGEPLDEASIEIIRKISSSEPFDEARFFGEHSSIDASRNTAESFGDDPVEAPKRELTTDDDSVASRCSKILEKLESCSVTSRLASEASHRASRDCDEGSIASRYSEISRLLKQLKSSSRPAILP